jgi:hypothetical protein
VDQYTGVLRGGMDIWGGVAAQLVSAAIMFVFVFVRCVCLYMVVHSTCMHAAQLAVIFHNQRFTTRKSVMMALMKLVATLITDPIS